MGQFFKFFFASCLGVIVAMAVLLGVGTLVVTAIASQVDKPMEVRPNSVLRINLDKAIPEKTNNLEMDPFDFKNQKILGLHDILRTLEAAKEDDNIKGVYIEVEALASSGFATASILRKGLEDFRESGKFVITYSRYYTQGAYYLASVSDMIYLNPIGLVDFRGFSAQVPFMKEMFDKLGMKWQVFYAGKFKSATEPYRRTEMSDEYRQQVREYLDQMYAMFLEDISKSRNVSIADLKNIADGYLATDPLQAKERGLVDAVTYEDEAMAEIRRRLGLEADEKIRMISIKDYFTAKPGKTDYSVKNRIAVVFAEGTVVDGDGNPGSIGDKEYSKIIDEVRENKNVKAVVLRVNSPGGSAMASENIWRALIRLKETGRPLVVSFGDYAASGGYYFACIGDTILAEPNTLTGSIGVFSMIPSVQELMNQKLGIRMDTVKTGKFSTGITPFYDMNEDEKRILQKRTDDLYLIFKQRVADGRNMSVERVDEIAQGRVWTGKKAKEIGLVDELGDMEKAIEIAANMAGLENYRLTEYPRTKDPLQQFIEQIFGKEDSKAETLLRTELSEWYPYYRFIKEVQDSKGVQARLPFFIPFR